MTAKRGGGAHADNGARRGLDQNLSTSSTALIIPAVIQCCRSWGFVRRHLLRELAAAGITQVLSDPRGAKRVIANPGLDTRRKRPPCVGITDIGGKVLDEALGSLRRRRIERRDRLLQYRTRCPT
jgi:hypothetical protein